MASSSLTPEGADPVVGAPRTNWSGNFRYSTDRVFAPGTVAEVVEVVRSSARVRALGTRHSFNGIADSTGAQISTRALCDAEIDPGSSIVRVGAGVRYGDLAVKLDAAGFALANMASLPHISVGGAIATATHGSGLANGNLATAVTALELVAGDGAVHRLSRVADGERFRMAVVGLGALGIVTHLTLAVQPRFRMVQTVYEDLPFAVLERQLGEVMRAGYSVSLFTDWAGSRVSQVWVKSRVGADGAVSRPEELFGARRASRKLHPLPEGSSDACTEQSEAPGAWYERLPHFRLQFQPSHGDELQSEYFLPFERGYEAIRAVERLRERVAPLLYISELRAVAADDLPLSMCYGRESLAIHFTWRREPEAVRAVLPAIEAALAPFGARPHWGKVYTMPGAAVRALYPRFAEFAEAVQGFDPGGRFRNASLTELLGQSPV